MNIFGNPECPYCGERYPAFQLIRHMKQCGDQHYGWSSYTVVTTTSSAPVEESPQQDVFRQLAQAGKRRAASERGQAVTR